MLVTVKKIALWRRDMENHPGALADALQPLSEAGADLRVLMAYRYPGDEENGAVEVFPVSGKKLTAVAQAAGFSPSSIPVLLVEGDNRAGLGNAIAKALGDAGINLGFAMVQVVGRRYSAILGLKNDAHARKAATLIKNAASATKTKR